MSGRGGHLTQAFIDLDNLSHNLAVLRREFGGRSLWPTIKANAYGHGAEVVARELTRLGYDTLCVAHVGEAAALREVGVGARLVVLSATLPEHADALVEHGCEPAVCTVEMVEALADAARRRNERIAVHVNVDTGMGRVGIRPDEADAFIERCRVLPGIVVTGLMSHFARADEADKTSALDQLARFEPLARRAAVEVRHMANSAAVFDLADAHFDAARVGISIYGLKPSASIANATVHELRPVLAWKTQVTFLKEVPAGTGLSYGHTFFTDQPSLIATVPAGYGDGLSRRLSNDCELLVGGTRCPQVGRITMDQSLVDVTRLRGRVAVGDEVVIIGRQGSEEITADELAMKLGTINYEIVTAIASRVPRVEVAAGLS